MQFRNITAIATHQDLPFIRSNYKRTIIKAQAKHFPSAESTNTQLCRTEKYYLYNEDDRLILLFCHTTVPG